MENMTELEALRLTHIIWDRVANNEQGDKWEEADTIGAFHHSCPCCEHVYQASGAKTNFYAKYEDTEESLCTRLCPLRGTWEDDATKDDKRAYSPDEEYGYQCEKEGSIYLEWQLASEVDNYEDASKYARKIADNAKAKYLALGGDPNGLVNP